MRPFDRLWAWRALFSTTPLLFSLGYLISTFAQEAEPLCQVTLVEKGTLIGHDFRSIAVWGQEAFAIEYSSEGPSHLRFITFEPNGENPRIVDSIDNFWDYQPRNFLVAAIDLISPPLLYAVGEHRIAIVDIRTRKMTGNWMSGEREFFFDLAIRGRTGFLVGEKLEGTMHLMEVRVIDLSDPASPKVIGKYTRPFDLDGSGSSPRISVAGPYACLAQGRRLDVIDMFDPTAPALSGTFMADTVLGSVLLQYTREVIPGSGYRALVGGEVVYVIDLTDPGKPQLQKRISTGGLWVDHLENPLEINHGNLVFVRDWNLIGSSSEVPAVKIFDLAGLGEPQRVGPANRAGLARQP